MWIINIEGSVQMKSRYTMKQLRDYIDQLFLMIENNQRAIYDLREELGSSAQIESKFSKFVKFLKNIWLRGKKKS